MSEIEEIVDEGVEHKTWKGKLWSVVKVILIIVVTGGLLYWVFSKVPFEKVKNRVENADKIWVAAAIICYFISMVIASWRLLSFFKSIGLKLDYRFNLRLYFLGLCCNVLLPGGIGGDGYKIYLLHKRYKLPTKKVFWAIFFDRLSGIWAIGLLTVSLIILIPQVTVFTGYYLPIGVFFGGSILYYIVAKRFFKDYFNNLFSAHAKAIGVQAMQLLAVGCLLLAQPDQYKFAPYLLTFLISSLSAIIPFSVGGAGVRDAFFLKLAAPFHLLTDMALYLTITFLLISVLVGLFGVYYIIRPTRLTAGLPDAEEDKGSASV